MALANTLAYYDTATIATVKWLVWQANSTSVPPNQKSKQC
jgi:hypothetical protein